MAQDTQGILFLPADIVQGSDVFRRKPHVVSIEYLVQTVEHHEIMDIAGIVDDARLVELLRKYHAIE